MSGTTALINPPKDAMERLMVELKMKQAFAAVRVQDTGPAPTSAQAFTTGSGIFFGPGGPQNDAARLLAHELAHVVQQREGR